MNTDRQELRVVGNSVEIGFTIQKMIQDGWVIDEQCPLSAFTLGSLEVGFVRYPTDEQLKKDSQLTRAQICAKARGVKATKAADAKKEVKVV